VAIACWPLYKSQHWIKDTSTWDKRLVFVLQRFRKLERGREILPLAKWILQVLSKTVLMSTPINFLQHQTDRKEPAILAYFYCDFRNPDTRDPLNLARSLLAQICFKQRSFPASLETAFDSCQMSGSPYHRRTNLAMITDMLLEVASQHRVTIFVNGLDECEGREDILDLFRYLGTQGTLLNILVSSRDEADIREALSEFPRMRLETASACLDRDIDSHINYRLATIGTSSG
jgi:hypothetical protein